MTFYHTTKENSELFVKAVLSADLLDGFKGIPYETLLEQNENGHFKLDFVQKLCDFWCLAQLAKSEYVLGEGRCVVGVGRRSGSTEDNLVMLENAIDAAPVGTFVADDDQKKTMSRIFIAAKSPEHAEKIFNAILDREGVWYDCS